jgi:thiol-disulfide isomerase/thioredoxin
MFFNLFSTIFLYSSQAIAENSCTLQSTPVNTERIDSTEDSLSELFAQTKGCFTVIELWASWCGPCVKIAPNVNDLHQKYPNVLFLSISTDAVGSKAEQFWKKHPPIGQKRRLESWSLEGLLKEYKTIGASFPGKIPYFVILDQNGTVLLELTEPKDLDDIEKLIQTKSEQ